MYSQQKIYTVREVAQLFSVTELTVRRWIKERKLPAVKLGGWRICESDIDQMIRAQRSLQRKQQK